MAHRRVSIVLVLWAALSAALLAAIDVKPPAAGNSVRFAVIGDSGTGERPQYALATRMAEARSAFPYEFVLMLGDNMYGSERPQDFSSKFEQPYAPLLAADVKFYASLGNHDDPNQRFFKPFNMNGERYYTFKRGSVRFFALDSNYMDQAQLDWVERQLQISTEEWKVAFFHHPLYSSGARHGSELDLRERLEPLFIEHSVDVVFAGHEHFYERIKPQHGIHHFVNGAAAKLRRGNIRGASFSAAGLDTDYSFMLVEIADRTLYFQTISNAGKRVDDGALEPAPSKRTTTSQ